METVLKCNHSKNSSVFFTSTSYHIQYILSTLLVAWISALYPWFMVWQTGKVALSFSPLPLMWPPSVVATHGRIFKLSTWWFYFIKRMSPTLKLWFHSTIYARPNLHETLTKFGFNVVYNGWAVYKFQLPTMHWNCTRSIMFLAICI